MRILAIDTATEACSVALWNDGTVNAHFELCPREHTQRILPMVQDILTTALARRQRIVFIDYLQELRGRGRDRFEQVTNISLDLRRSTASWLWRSASFPAPRPAARTPRPR